ncbi:MAG: hypothetical protein ACLR1P_08375 [Oscillospiraceae bacterium]
MRITWGGSKDYAAWQWHGNVAVTGRAAAPFTRKEGVTEVSMVYNKRSEHQLRGDRAGSARGAARER